MLNKNRYYRIFPFIIVLFSALYSCEKERDDTIPEPEYLVESRLLIEYSRNEILDMFDAADDVPTDFSFLIQNDISVYRIVYQTTDVNNNPILASGAVVVPVSNSPFPVLSFQHGTLLEDLEAPSYFTSDEYITAVIYASAGYIISLPDYIGYGVSNHIDHPYEHGKSLATASLDMLRAVREFDRINDEFQSAAELFLTGYSAGGYATMAMLKMIEENWRNEFKVTAATAGAGAYNKTEFSRYLMGSQTNQRYLNSFLWVLDTYNSIYSLDRPYSYYYNEPYAGIIEAEGVFANTELNPQNLFTTVFREGILQGTDTEFLNILSDNDNFDWKPSVPLQLYHGTADDYVYYFNSVSAYDAMRDRGASVNLITIDGGDHFTSTYTYFLGTFMFFSSF